MEPKRSIQSEINDLKNHNITNINHATGRIDSLQESIYLIQKDLYTLTKEFENNLHALRTKYQMTNVMPLNTVTGGKRYKRAKKYKKTKKYKRMKKYKRTKKYKF